MTKKNYITDEPQGEYQTEADEAMEMLGKGYENAAEIHPPKTIKVLREGGLAEYKVWGWVKTSTKFIYHIKKLKGAKLAIWQVISLSIDKDGECKLSIHEIAEMAGYSYSETQESLKELDAMNYLSINKESGKKSVYSPNFAARGDNQPTEYPSRKARGQDDEPLQSSGSDPSSPSIEKSTPSIKELKELIDIRFAKIQMALEKIGILLTSTDPWKIDTWMEKHADDKIQKAIDITQAKGIHNLAYVNTILAGWLENGYPVEKTYPKKKQDTGQTALEKYAQSIGAI